MFSNILIALDTWRQNRYNELASGCSAVGSAPALGAGCRRFKSCHSDQSAVPAANVAVSAANFL